MEEMSRFKNEVEQAEQKREKGESSTRIDSHKLDKRHKSNKCQPLLRGPRYEHYTPLTTSRATILKKAFNIEVPIQLLALPPHRSGLDKTKHYRYHRNHGHNTKDC